MAYVNTTHSTRLELLTRENYDTWKIQTEALLIKNDTWPYVSGENVAPEVIGEGDALAAAQVAHKAWVMADRKAKADLILSISPSELQQIRGCVTSREVWNKLESVYASKGPARKATLLKCLMQQKMKDGDEVNQHLAEFFDAVDKLQALKVDINGELLTIMLLYSLPESYDNFRCAIESRDNLPDAESLKVKILEEFNARKIKGDENVSGAMFAKSGHAYTGKPKNSTNDRAGNEKPKNKLKPKYACGYCKKKGHKESECYSKKNAKHSVNNQTNNANDSANCCFLINKDSTRTANRLWCIDSGCTSHLCTL